MIRLFDLPGALNEDNLFINYVCLLLNEYINQSWHFHITLLAFYFFSKTIPKNMKTRITFGEIAHREHTAKVVPLGISMIAAYALKHFPDAGLVLKLL